MKIGCWGQKEVNQLEQAIEEDKENLTKEMSLERRMGTYHRMLQRAKYAQSRKHVAHLRETQRFGLMEIEGSDRMPMGRVSVTIYDNIWNTRKFDKYARQVNQKLSKKTQLLEDMQATFAMRSGEAGTHYQGGKRGSAVKQLKTEKEKIGRKPTRFAAIGLAQDPAGELNSEGFEGLFSYDGEWIEGRPHGWGRYKFADGSIYEGRFRRGKPDGDGTATYPSGTQYIGEWKEGKYHGRGKLIAKTGITFDGMWRMNQKHGYGKVEYPSGMTYRGNFFVGKKSGYGVIESPKTGIRFEGQWDQGAINGSGVLWYGRRRVAKSWRTLHGKTFMEVIQWLLDEDMEKKLNKEEDNQFIYGISTEMEIADYVEDVRQEFIDARRERKNNDYEAIKKRREEERKKAKEARMTALMVEQESLSSESLRRQPDSDSDEEKIMKDTEAQVSDVEDDF